MTHLEQVTAALTDLIGRPFEKSRGQKGTLRKGHTTDGVIASLPGQIADLRSDIAEQLSEVLGMPVPVDVIEPWMVAHLTVLDAAVSGFGIRTIWRDLRPDVLIQIGMALQGDWWRNLYWSELGREPDPAGLAWWQDRVAQLFRDSIR